MEVGGEVDEGEGMAVFLRKRGFFSQTSASQSQNETTHGWCSPRTVPFPRAHLVFGAAGLEADDGAGSLSASILIALKRGCESPDWEES